MEDRFKLLDCNEDVLTFSGPEQTFKLGNFRERVSQQFRSKLDNYSGTEGFGFITVEGRQIYSSNLIWKSTTIDCEILRLGSKNWQKGKLRIQVSLERVAVANYYPSRQRMEIQHVYLEFCSEEPEINQPESPLDDIRQMINQEPQQ
jgi:hypothetical protein